MGWTAEQPSALCCRKLQISFFPQYVRKASPPSFVWKPLFAVSRGLIGTRSRHGNTRCALQVVDDIHLVPTAQCAADALHYCSADLYH
jgi:hypothetical protein